MAQVKVTYGAMKGTIIEATEHILQPLVDAGRAQWVTGEKEEKHETETKELKTRGRKTKNG